MSDYRNRPKGVYIQEAPWGKLYVLTQHWKSDLEFYKDDLRFLHHLIDKYFIWITKEENLEIVKKIRKNLFEAGKRSKDLLDKVSKHLVQIGYLVESSKEANARVFKMEHEHLEDEIVDFIKSFRQNRKEAFAITEYVIDSEELPHILKS